jgi:hypothetical protein
VYDFKVCNLTLKYKIIITLIPGTGQVVRIPASYSGNPGCKH